VPEESHESTDDEKQPAEAKADPETTTVDPNLLSAQLQPAQQQPAEDQPVQVDDSSETESTAAVTNLTAAGTEAQSKAAKAQPDAKPAESTDAEPELVVKPHAQKGHHASDEELLANADDAAGAIRLPPEMTKADAKSTAETKLDPSAALQAVAAPHDKASASHVAAMPAIQQADAAVSTRTVAEENVDRIVTSIHGDIATKGGTMQIRLDPPSLGAINVQISIDDGVMSASLQTNNDEATRLLSHNLAQLKSQLESAGVTVDRIQVKQATPTEQSSNSNSQNDSGDRQQNRDAGQDQSARQEQQRREMLQRMWAKLAGNGDPLDLVA
jgi:flagellar hook-length control protein FliK